MKRTKSPGYLKLHFVLSLIFMSLWACNVREPGCLDIEAENFDVAAERHDGSLCIYPNLVLSVEYQWADSSLQTGYLYHNAHGMDYAIHAVQILFSDFRVTNETGEIHTVDEQIELPLGSCGSISLLEVPDDFLFADRSAFRYPIGAFRESGFMEKVHFTLGVPDNYTPMCIDSLPDNHLLRGTRAGYDPVLSDFAIARFIVSQDSVNAMRDTFFVYHAPEELEFDVDRSFRQGRPDTLFMTINFHQIFDPVDLSQSDSLVAIDLAVRIRPSILVQ